MKKWVLPVIACFTLCICVLVAGEKDDSDKPAYVGVKKCKTCHKKKKKGSQYEVWKTLKHSKAWEELATEKARKIAKAKGIDDPQKSEKCTKCHVAGGLEKDAKFGDKYTKEEGVSCEACHGPGEKYKKSHKKKETLEQAKKEDGLLVPDESTCKKCHNDESPTFKKEEWDYKKKLKKIDHDNPEIEGNKFDKK